MATSGSSTGTMTTNLTTTNWTNAVLPTTTSSAPPNDYVCSDKGILMPFLDESTWSVPVRALLYLLGLLYSFFGISIAADVFMGAIERITSATRRVKINDSDAAELDDSTQGTQYKEVRIWNPTVANLTLMALGSSAPEILLSCIEIIGRGFKAGQLGPSTIVGSAAFNLLVITAVCIFIIPAGESRRIAQIGVFAVTSASSVFAYLWLIIILTVISPNEIDLLESVVTLLFFVLLVVIAYFVDKNFCKIGLNRKGSGSKVGSVALGPVPPQTANGIRISTAEDDMQQLKDNMTAQDENGEYVLQQNGKDDVETITAPHSAQSRPGTTVSIVQRSGSTWSGGLQHFNVMKSIAAAFPNANAEQIAKLSAQKINAKNHHSRLYYRIKATRRLTAAGGGWEDPTASLSSQDEPGMTDSHRPLSAVSNLSRISAVPSNRISVIQFAAIKYAVSETQGHVMLKVVRTGRLGKRVLFRYETLDGTARGGKDFKEQSETLVFNAKETEKQIGIQLIDDTEREPDEIFYVKLGLEEFADGATMIGPNSVATVTISDSDKETKLQFSQPACVVKENEGVVHIPVVRRGNTRNRCSVHWVTVDGTATNGKDYSGGQGELMFESGEVEKWIEIPIIDDKEFEKHESFQVKLYQPSEGVSLNGKKNRCVVTILNDDEMTLLLTQSDKLVAKELEELQPGSQTWSDQFRTAVNVNGGDIQSATKMDYVVHVITFGWKLLFAFIPPAHLLGGWLTFIFGISAIGLLTAIVGDFASIFGCLVGLEEAIVAITLVAIGTSLPDLFASKIAATEEDTADNSVGNVTGSNSVNVFLGLGVSWFIAAAYWSTQSVPSPSGDGSMVTGKFTVQAGSLVFSVALYTILSLVCIGLLVVRRLTGIFGRAELGGSVTGKYASGALLIFLWFFYVLLSALKTKEII